MKKKIAKITYQDNPWGDDEPTLGNPLGKDFLPSPDEIKKAKVRVLQDYSELSLPIRADDAEILLRKSNKAGLSPEAFVIGVLHDFLTGKLTHSTA